MDEIKHAGFNGNYLREASTRKSAKEGWRSDLGDYMTYENWTAAGSSSRMMLPSASTLSRASQH